MKCNQCLDTVTTVGNVRGCRTCSMDGTANEIPKDMNNSDALDSALERKPGLAARFLPDRSNPPGPDSPQGRNPAPGVTPAYDRDRINSLERRQREHTITADEQKELSELLALYPAGTKAQTWTVSVGGTKSQSHKMASEQSDKNIDAGLMTKAHKAKILKAIDEAPGNDYVGSFGGTPDNPGIGEL